MKETLTKSKVKSQNILNMDRCATNDKTLYLYYMDFQIVLRSTIFVAKANIGT